VQLSAGSRLQVINRVVVQEHHRVGLPTVFVPPLTVRRCISTTITRRFMAYQTAIGVSVRGDAGGCREAVTSGSSLTNTRAVIFLGGGIISIPDRFCLALAPSPAQGDEMIASLPVVSVVSSSHPIRRDESRRCAFRFV
jgi:hypothetical protein